MLQYLGVIFLGCVALNMWALQAVVMSNAGLLWRLVWATVLIAVPLFGFVAWYLMGPRRNTA